MSELCSTCLSSHRKLTPLTSLKRSHIFDSIFWLVSELDTETSCLCWECSAMLLRIHRFQQQVLRAQGLLALHRNTAAPSEHLESLSKLSVYTKLTYDDVVLQKESVKTEREDENNYHCEVKIEIDLNNEYKYDLQIEETKKAEESETAAKSNSKCIKNTKKCMKNTKETTKRKKLVKESESQSKEISSLNKGELIENHKKKIGVNIEENQSPDKEESEKTRNDLQGDHETLKKKEETYIISEMSMEELLKAREEDSNLDIYKSRPYKCVTCIKGFKTEEKFSYHVNKFHSEKHAARECSVCCMRFTKEETLCHHRQAHFKRFQCRECTYTHHRLQAMLVHTNKEHRVRTLECSICNKGFLTKGKLKYHKQKDHGERLTCKVCDKVCTTPINKKKHEQMHEKTEREECPQCGGKYRYLREHMKRTHAPAAGEDAYCAECNRQFRSVFIYRNHLRMHANHRQPDALKFPCPHCAAKFVVRFELQRHVAVVHTKQYPLRCDTCDKGFYSKNVLRMHIQEKHEGIDRPRDKICSYCGKAFKHGQVLKKHIRTHTGEKPYACDLCPWRFAQKSALKTHVRALHPDANASGASVRKTGAGEVETTAGEISSV